MNESKGTTPTRGGQGRSAEEMAWGGWVALFCIVGVAVLVVLHW